MGSDMKDNSIDRMPVCSCKYYGIFAVSKKDPTDILGYVENSFNMGWSRRFVRVWTGYKKSKVEQAVKHWFEGMKENSGSACNLDDERYEKWFKDHCADLYEDGMTIDDMRKAYWDEIYKMHAATILAQNVWSNMANRLYVPEGYVVKKFRINAKCCPVEVDLRYRTAYDRGKDVKWDKWRYRNALFSVKALNLDKERPLSSVLPKLENSLAIPATQLADVKGYWHEYRNAPAEKLAKRDHKHMSRSERKILKKQRANSRQK